MPSVHGTFFCLLVNMQHSHTHKHTHTLLQNALQGWGHMERPKPFTHGPRCSVSCSATTLISFVTLSVCFSSSECSFFGGGGGGLWLQSSRSCIVYEALMSWQEPACWFRKGGQLGCISLAFPATGQAHKTNTDGCPQNMFKDVVGMSFFQVNINRLGKKKNCSPLLLDCQIGISKRNAKDDGQTRANSKCSSHFPPHCWTDQVWNRRMSTATIRRWPSC